MILFKSKYRTRIEIARWKATIKLGEIEKEKEQYKTYKQTSQMCSCIVRVSSLQDKIDLMDAFLKGREVEF